MKVFALLAVAIVMCVEAVPYHGHVNTGSSNVHRSDDGHGNYAFSYDENHASGGSFRKEKGGHGVQVGSYGLTDHDGRQRIVNYVADAHGFRASIKTNEPGVDSKEDPADVSINGGHGIVSHGPVVGYAKAEYGHGGYNHGGYNGGYGNGYGYGNGGYGNGHGISGSYGVNIHHASYAEPTKVIAYGYGGHGKY
ncbi:unnamed protein product [Medioppia subpectinata]|uniref:Uncharacterized protein n=1 Tax=Medioppia subpectinata TaxID=1979941 RepID=A0A7R9KZD4_9ACAR|nr:unnamed protein product [Medioppia subpectinata]CAG2112408.1 unnamed protein product [Medioppia subpectinata]